MPVACEDRQSRGPTNYVLLLNCLDLALNPTSKRKVLPVTAAVTAAHPTLFARACLLGLPIFTTPSTGPCLLLASSQISGTLDIWQLRRARLTKLKSRQQAQGLQRPSMPRRPCIPRRPCLKANP